jgi:hypothetical protein
VVKLKALGYSPYVRRRFERAMRRDEIKRFGTISISQLLRSPVEDLQASAMQLHRDSKEWRGRPLYQ